MKGLQSCIYPDPSIMPNKWDGEPNDPISIVDQFPSMSLKEMAERFMATGEVPNGDVGAYFDEEEQEDDLVPIPQNTDISDVFNAINTIEAGNQVVRKSRKKKEADEAKEALRKEIEAEKLAGSKIDPLAV